jgi:hypothetical protein
MNKTLDHARTLARLQRIARLMDTAWGIPFTRWRFGLDSVLGLVPGAGDAVNLGVGLYTLHLARKLGAPRNLLVKMLANTAADFGLGTIPIAGDIFDLFFKSNMRNIKLLTDFLEKKRPQA